jgi:hypothetical protein
MRGELMERVGLAYTTDAEMGTPDERRSKGQPRTVPQGRSDAVSLLKAAHTGLIFYIGTRHYSGRSLGVSGNAEYEAAPVLAVGPPHGRQGRLIECSESHVRYGATTRLSDRH